MVTFMNVDINTAALVGGTGRISTIFRHACSASKQLTFMLAQSSYSMHFETRLTFLFLHVGIVDGFELLLKPVAVSSKVL